jgi:hypothetical protein
MPNSYNPLEYHAFIPEIAQWGVLHLAINVRASKQTAFLHFAQQPKF